MRDSHVKPSVGVLLLDANLRLVHYTAEAASILSYPKKAQETALLRTALPASRSQLASLCKIASPAAIEFTSGRRRYLCRVFRLDSTGQTDGRIQPTVVVILERLSSQPVNLSRASEEFQLTIRERETVTFLMKGLTSKEIAQEMNISPNTVKSFLKLVMAKVGASNRTGIMAKILERTS